MRRGLWATGVLALFCLLAMLSCAAGENEIVLEAGIPGWEETVHSRLQRRGYILSLPGCWDPSRVLLRVEGQEKIYLGDKQNEIAAGEPTDLTGFLGKQVLLFDHNRQRLGTVIIYRGSPLTALFIHADEGGLALIRQSKENELTEGRVVVAEADGSVSFDGELTQLRGRGNNTFSYSKKPYQIKLKKKAGPGGMSPAKTWVLLAGWTDISLLRNQIVLDLSADIGIPYAIDCRQADVWINGEYHGLYLLTEKIQIKSNRVNIRDLEEETVRLNDQPPEQYPMYRQPFGDVPLTRGYRIPNNPEDITGGYILSIEKYHRLRDYKLPGFRTAGDLSIKIKEPTCPSEEQVNYLAELFSAMHRAVIAKDGVDKSTGKTVRDFLDFPSFERRFLVEEWTKNYDFSGGSQILIKDSDERDPLIYAGPSWDYDLCFGNMRDRGFTSTGAYVTALSHKTSNLYWLLSRHGEFAEETAELWKAVFRPAAAVLLGEKEPEEGQRLRAFDVYRAEIEDSAEMNYVRWSVGEATASQAGKNFRNATAYLKKWITERTAWMDKAYGGAERTDKKQN